MNLRPAGLVAFVALVAGRAASVPAQSAKADEPLRFVVLGHIRGGVTGGLNPKLGELLTEVRRLRPEFVVLTGDIVSSLQVAEAETGVRRLVDTGNAMVRQAWQQQAATRQAELQRVFSAAGVDHLAVATDRSPVYALDRFFRDRQRRLSR